jgi:glucose-6-phosphate 1-dehydrogenase
MLKIQELKINAEKALSALDAFDVDSWEDRQSSKYQKLLAESVRANTAYFNEQDEAHRLFRQYEKMNDGGTGAVNAGDTYTNAKYGDIRFRSTEYWQCAINSAAIV